MSILREHTNTKHREAEDTPFVQYMLHGNITVPHYAQYLQQMQAVYKTIEHFAEKAGLLTDFPDIQRSQYMLEDLAELGYDQSVALLPSIQRWCDHIEQLYNSDQQELIMAHVYVRHMGDMYGGKAIAKRVPGSGRAYGFEDRPALIKAFDTKLHMGLVNEALLAFDLAIDFFHELQQETKLDTGS
jgi:heme oxygenase (biliverdin-producing, ferredoxin)